MATAASSSGVSETSSVAVEQARPPALSTAHTYTVVLPVGSERKVWCGTDRPVASGTSWVPCWTPKSYVRLAGSWSTKPVASALAVARGKVLSATVMAMQVDLVHTGALLRGATMASRVCSPSSVRSA